MTDEALREVRAALAGKATRQTAVACYQNDGHRRMKLLWIVGSRSRFGPGGHFPAGRRKRREAVGIADWVRHAGLVARLAGLLHDFGKYSRWFQDKLRDDTHQQWDAIRHEWRSLRLWQSLRAGENWTAAWGKNCSEGDRLILGDREIRNASRYGVASARECVDALIATHHGLFSSDIPKANGRLIKLGCEVSPVLSVPWERAEVEAHCKTARRLDARLNAASESMDGEKWTPYWRAVFLYARAALVLADHTVSAQQSSPGSPGIAFANTCFRDGKRQCNQPLEEHLTRVSERAANTVWRLAELAAHPEASLDGLEPCAREALLRPADVGRFGWQNEAAEALAEARETWPDVGVLVFNMAGTGSGKTRMNVRVACVLSQSGAPRLSIALNLRSLTLQTGNALQRQLGIGESDLATVIGDSVTRALFEAARNGHDSDGWIDDDGNPVEAEAMTSGGVWMLPAWLESFLPKAQERRIVGAPLLVSTIDYLIAAGEPHRQGHHVKALLRLMSADLVLDEVDAYEPEPLVAVLRLVQLSALFGRNVICSSATLSHPVAQAVADAYTSGADMARRLRNGKRAESVGKEGPLFLQAFIDDGTPPSVQAVPVTAGEGLSASAEAFSQAYARRLEEQLAGIAQNPVCRRAELFPLKDQTVASWSEAVRDAASQLHARHAMRDEQTGVRYSFGLVRVANIRTAVDTARYLADELPHSRIACYHAGDWRISRFHKEQRLDFLLSRAAGDGHIVADAEIRSLLEGAAAAGQADIPFIVVATPVEEVGRDHDFDWAVVDISSAQSLVQTAGRVNRHRLCPCTEPNIIVPQFNWRHCYNAENGNRGKKAFCWPGYEEDGNGKRYSKHDLAEILPWVDGCLDITAAVRLKPETCKLAKRDDKAIEERLKAYFGESGERLFTALPVASQLLSEDIYNDTPLRSRQGEPQRWRLRRDGFGEKYERYVPEKRNGRLLESWVDCNDRDFRSVGARVNAWLWLDAEGMSELCAAAGVEE